MGELKEEGASDDVILQYYFIARTRKSFGRKKIDSPVDYFRVIFEHNQETDTSERKQPDSPGQRFFFNAERFNQCMKDWRNIEITEFLQALYYYKKNDPSRAIELENCAAYERISLPTYSDSTILIIDANPDFIHCCVENDRISEKMLLLGSIANDVRGL